MVQPKRKLQAKVIKKPAMGLRPISSQMSQIKARALGLNSNYQKINNKQSRLFQGSGAKTPKSAYTQPRKSLISNFNSMSRNFE